MALVNYSDSEASDVEEAPKAPTPTPKPTTKPAFQKVIDRSEPRKIKVDLPTLKPEPGQQDAEQPPTKRARTGGAFSGFNSMLPAPRRAAQTGPKPGVSLKTSSEAAFSRQPAPAPLDTEVETSGDAAGTALPEPPQAAVEPKIVGKATKFRPLSVANNKKKPAKKPKAPVENANGDTAPATKAPTAEKQAPAVPEPPPPKPKRSLFSVQAEEPEDAAAVNGNSYEAMTTNNEAEPEVDAPAPASTTTAQTNTNSLATIANDMNLTPAQRRQLFGRNAKDADINIAHFNMDSEYAANEQLRQAGEVVEHRAVKAIAPGKHSLQQLVNNARSQQDAMEDKWAEGRRERGEAGGKYGWGK